ncbi:hypothetical protein QKU48_gp0060 [Fadolivirus algeromassiliense]|jgi:hypothetical protein|uniref:Uncharacterized protein n=1 Tax=Fadolivirus FV1/VV64 TaxID=3070911 RepID=A0A7D3R132_9VIRU|nr:hypothetical protein QKU48_gp0060 [Fadolivirus algeromassiliense]QKF93518.1 hypothetical protein Fadolivirus_1_60 [Fadolivirus FV1/VV64]
MSYYEYSETPESEKVGIVKQSSIDKTFDNKILLDIKKTLDNQNKMLSRMTKTHEIKQILKEIDKQQKILEPYIRKDKIKLNEIEKNKNKPILTNTNIENNNMKQLDNNDIVIKISI